MEEYKLNFLAHPRPKGTLTITKADKPAILQAALHLGLPADTSFSNFVRKLLSNYNEITEAGLNPAERLVIEPVKAGQREAEKFDIQFNAEIKDLKALKIRKSKGLSRDLSDMARQALSYLVKDPTGSYFMGKW